MQLAGRYLRAGGCLIVSAENPYYSCLEWDGTRYVVARPYVGEGPQEYASWKGVPIVTHHRTLGTFVRYIVAAGLHVEALVETPLNPAAVGEAHVDPARWYSVARARLVPTTFIVKARKPRVPPNLL